MIAIPYMIFKKHLLRTLLEYPYKYERRTFLRRPLAYRYHSPTLIGQEVHEQPVPCI